MNKRIIACCLLLAALASCQSSTSVKSTDVEKRVEELLAKMTLEEKIGQMNQISPSGDVSSNAELIKKGEVGSILNIADAKTINAYQRTAVEQSRLGIPLIVGRDVIHGFKTIFPIPLGQAASFNPQLIADGARVAAIEAASV
ncbi:MAG: glycosyl hydrolase, partial [Parabacteroides sp.]|nr:glycosyl hydrolase [Parabacteroides sp.]